MCYYTIGKSYYFLKDFINSVHYCSLARKLNLQNREKSEKLIQLYYTGNDPFLDNDLVLGEAFMDNNQLDSALLYFRRLYNESADSSWKAIISIFLGDALFRKGEKESGIGFLKNAFHKKQEEEDDYSIAWASSILARCYKELNQIDSSIYYAKVALQSAQQVGFKDRMLKSARHLAEVYEKIDTIEAYSYLKLATTLNDGLFGQEKVFELQKTLSNAQLHQQESEKREIELKNKVKLYLLLVGLAIIISITLILYYNNKKEKKAKSILEDTLKELRSTQAQLIQSEKMASLGELTAGIAHEIQNPLNFVNNFSDVSSELIDEMNTELIKGDIEEAKAISSDLKQNLEKINQHGLRASSIVKGMLEHSRKSSGVKELTDINKLCDEYLRLAHQAQLAKNKDLPAGEVGYKCEVNTEFDEDLPMINIIPQDMGRVLLNLINNAFYAVKNVENPLVNIKTERNDHNIIIKVMDNGIGIPEEIRGKIFQPFFTTKPTGQGTGLGLSLVYDIVKAYGGSIEVKRYSPPAGGIKSQRNENTGTEFIINLPL